MSQQIDKIKMYEKRIPELLSFLLRNGHKGERGRIGVVGGCELYTGHTGFQFNVICIQNQPTNVNQRISIENHQKRSILCSDGEFKIRW